MDEAAWDRAFENKLRGTVRCIRLAVPAMRERKWGRIVNISGGAAWTPQLGAIATGYEQRRGAKPDHCTRE